MSDTGPRLALSQLIPCIGIVYAELLNQATNHFLLPRRKADQISQARCTLLVLARSLPARHCPRQYGHNSRRAPEPGD